MAMSGVQAGAGAVVLWKARKIGRLPLIDSLGLTNDDGQVCGRFSLQARHLPYAGA